MAMAAALDATYARLRPWIKSTLKSLLPDPTYHVALHLGFCVRFPRTMIRSMGAAGSLRFMCLPIVHEAGRLLAGDRVARRTYKLTARAAAFPLDCRVGSSDVEVFRQIFVEGEYRCVHELQDPRVMLDCGANVGFATAWFLSRYRGLHSIAVEPDPANVAALKANLAPFGDRVTVHESGVWSRPTGLKLVHGEFGDGREWAIQVRESESGETPDMTAVDIRTLLDAAGVERLDILKIDVEGAEGEIFGCARPDWLARVQNLVIETHSSKLEAIVDAAIPAAEFSRSRSGELTVYERMECGPEYHSERALA